MTTAIATATHRPTFAAWLICGSVSRPRSAFLIASTIVCLFATSTTAPTTATTVDAR